MPAPSDFHQLALRFTDPVQHRYPEVVVACILHLIQLYPPIRHREIARIIGCKYGYKTNHHTVKAFLACHAIPAQLPLTVTGFHQFDDAYWARWTVVRLFIRGLASLKYRRSYGLVSSARLAYPGGAVAAAV